MASSDNAVSEGLGVTASLDHIYFFVQRATAHNAPLALTSEQQRGSCGMNPLAADFQPRQQQHEHSAPVHEDRPLASLRAIAACSLYEVRRTADRGAALFAATFLKRGTLIVCEEPLLKISENVIHHVWRPYCRLSSAQRTAYDSLHSFTPETLDLEHASRLHLIGHWDAALDQQDIEEDVAEQVHVMSVFAVNSYALPPRGLAVYAIASRLNHSCLPNVHHSYNPTLNRITVHAARDILPDEELLTSYLGREAVYQPRHARNEILRSAYGFTCQCPACSDHTGASDERRAFMEDLARGLDQFKQRSTLQHPLIPATNLSALKQAEDLISVMLQEGVLGMELTSAYRTASTFALELKHFDRALQHAYHEAEVERSCLGTKIKDLFKIEAASALWIERIYLDFAAEKGEDAVKVYRSTVRNKKRKMHKS